MAEHRKARPATWPRRVRPYTPKHSTRSASEDAGQDQDQDQGDARQDSGQQVTGQQ